MPGMGALRLHTFHVMDICSLRTRSGIPVDEGAKLVFGIDPTFALVYALEQNAIPFHLRCIVKSIGATFR